MVNEGIYLVRLNAVGNELVEVCIVDHHKIKESIIIIELDLRFVARQHGVFDVWEIDLMPSVFFVSGMRKDQDYFFSFLAEHYPHDLNFILFHPELFSGQFNP